MREAFSVKYIFSSENRKPVSSPTAFQLAASLQDFPSQCPCRGSMFLLSYAKNTQQGMQSCKVLTLCMVIAWPERHRKARNAPRR